MKLYNTLTRKLEDFNPIRGNKVLFYQCGPTVYWIQHIGNMRAMTWSDLIRRVYLYLDYDVTFVRNYTDVGHLTSDQDQGEDKMEKGAKREGLSPTQIADKYIKIFESDIMDLNIMQPTHTPRATEYIKQIIEMVQVLLDKGYAYVTDYAVCFDVSKFKDYNKLNHQKLDLNIKGSGKGTVEDPGKHHFADFNLWVFKKGSHKNALQTWSSPWGEGFPGWHIECSVMAKQLLSNTIDLHMGGVEHIAVHHTNEIAQSEAANGVKFVNYWLHNEHLNVDDAKMAKSQGTGFTLQEIKEKGFDPMDLRYFFLQAHYRSKQNFTWEALSAAKEGYKNLKEHVLSLKVKPSHFERSEKSSGAYKNQFVSYISNDFQIPQALALTWEVLKSDLDAKSKYDLIVDFDKVFGLRISETKKDIIPAEIIDLAELRKIAKENKDFSHADNLRRLIEEKGFIIEDAKEGYKIKKK